MVSDTTPDSEELVLKGAAAGIPMVMSRTEKEKIFLNMENQLFFVRKQTLIHFQQESMIY